MIVLIEEQHDLPTVEVSVIVKTGASTDAVGSEGLARHAAELMRRGAGGKTRLELDLALDALGASIDVEASQDVIAFRGHCLSRTLDDLMALLADVVVRPDFPDAEHEKLRRESLALLDEVRDDDASLCGRFFERYALEGHPYGRTALGTAPSLAGLRREDTLAWVRKNVVRANLLVGFAGDVDEARARVLADRAFGSLPEGPAPERQVMAAPGLGAGRRTFLIDKPERAQSQILLGHGGPKPSDPAWMALHVGSVAFGGTFTARLMTEVRVKRGWSYGAGCRVGRARGGHAFRIKVFPALAQTAGTLELVLQLWEQIAKEGLTQAELDFTKSYLEGSWAFEIDTAGERLEHRLDTISLELPAEHYTRWLDNLRAVTLDEVNAALARFYHPESAVVVVTTTAEELLPLLKDLPLGKIEVVPYDSY